MPRERGNCVRDHRIAGGGGRGDRFAAHIKDDRSAAGADGLVSQQGVESVVAPGACRRRAEPVGTFERARDAPKATIAQAKGFALAVTKMVFAGEIDDVAIQPDGKLVLAGTANINPAAGLYEITVTRVNPNGTIDQGFGTGGTTIVTSKGLIVAR